MSGLSRVAPTALLALAIVVGAVLVWSTPDPAPREVAEPEEEAEPEEPEPEPTAAAAPMPAPQPVQGLVQTAEAAPPPPARPELEPEPAAAEPTAVEEGAAPPLTFEYDPRHVLEVPEHLEDATEEAQREYFEQLLFHHEAMLESAHQQLEHLQSRAAEDPSLEQHIEDLRRNLAVGEAQAELLREHLAE